MNALQALILGLVQGLTEFLPVSSSGHLILVPWIFDWQYLLQHPEFNKTFDVALHMGTLLALLVYFWRDIGRLLAAFFGRVRRRRISGPSERLAWLLLVSTVPAGLVGVAFESVIERRLGEPWLTAVMMLAFALVMYLVDRFGRLERTIGQVGLRDAVLIGLAQAVALIPGVSRSSITMVAGMGLRFTRETAARYSFLMSIPVIGGAAVYRAAKTVGTGLPAGSGGPVLIGMAAAAVSGFVAIWFMLAYLRRHDFTPFVIYRLAVGVGALLLMAAGVRSALGL